MSAMSDKKKVILIYVGVGVISIFILGMAMLLASLRKQRDDAGPIATGVGVEIVDEILTLDADQEFERENGEKVMLSSLYDKVWVAVQFYAVCPECGKRNADSLLKLYQEFRDEEDFVIVCFSIDPAADTPEQLAAMHDGMGTDPKNWWYLKREQKEMWDFLSKEMWFLPVKERPDPLEAAAKGRWEHDLGKRIFRGNVMTHKWDESKGYDVLRTEVKRALRELKEERAEL